MTLYGPFWFKCCDAKLGGYTCTLHSGHTGRHLAATGFQWGTEPEMAKPDKDYFTILEIMVDVANHICADDYNALRPDSQALIGELDQRPKAEKGQPRPRCPAMHLDPPMQCTNREGHLGSHIDKEGHIWPGLR